MNLLASLRSRLARLSPVLLKKSVDTAVHISYGNALDDRSSIHGGRVKLLTLEKMFPHQIHANGLYLVSSALPSNLDRWIRRAKKLGIPIFLNQNGVGYPAWAGEAYEKVNAPLKRALKAADYVFYQSLFCKVTSDRFLGERTSDYEILFNPVDTENFVPACFQNSPPRSCRILLAGSQYQKYRVFSALETLKNLRERGLPAILGVTGRIDWNGRPEACVNEIGKWLDRNQLSDAVRFHGPYTQKEAPSIYQQYDLLLHTKINDPCPGVVIEAMACGLPIVYSSTGGIPELVGAEAGIGVKTQADYQSEIAPHPESWAIAIQSAFEHRESMSLAARQRAVLSFRAENWVERHRDVFRRFVLGPK